MNTPSVIDRTVGHENTRNWERPGGSRDPENSTTTTLVTYGQLNQWDFGGSVWESNLLGADSSSTYEEGLGLNWKDLPSFGILNAAFLPPRIFIPLFSSEEPFQRLDCWPPASHRAPLACKCSLLCECPNAAEALAEPSSPLATNEAVWSTNAGNCASRSDQLQRGFRQEASDRAESSTAIVDAPSHTGLGTTNHDSLLLELSRPCTQPEGPPSSDAPAVSCLSSWS